MSKLEAIKQLPGNQKINRLDRENFVIKLIEL
jgi:hypothetical protein